MNVTRDTLWRGRLVLWQPARGHGYRFNLDPVLLADFVRPARHVVDLGAGVGILGVLLLASGKVERVTAVEIQPELADLAARNASENGFGGRFEVMTGDFRALDLPRAEAVVFNPPYHPAVAGRGAPERGRDAARHERYGTLSTFVRTAVGLVTGEGGHVAAIVPSRREPELLASLRAEGARGVRRRAVVPRAGASPGQALVEARWTAGGDEEEPALVVHAEAGRDFSVEVQRMLREGPPS